MPLSPLTNREAILEFDYSEEKLIALYKNELNMDVSGFFETNQSIGLYRCEESGFRFFAPESIAGDGPFYSDLVKNKHSYYTPWKWEHQNALTFLQNRFAKNDVFRLLEIGCAEGLFLKAVRTAFPNCEIHGLEINETAIADATKNQMEVHLGYIEDFATNHAGTFDVVLAFQVLEHIPNIRSFIDASVQTLQSGGILLYGVPNNNSYIFKEDHYHTLNLPPHHMGWWDSRSLNALKNYFPLMTLRLDEEPADLSNLGVYFDVWLKKYLPHLRPVLYPLLRFPVKLALRVFKPKRGLTITAIFEKTNS
ncbi:MAG: methyltransferase domain-containing protein [Bacteroidetes bacterium]|nr:methyltransferase domain-containing protein [Bacteroidota bacterium]